MAKSKKKRNKQYTGINASIQQPTITRVQAVKRNPLSQWWLEKKRIAKPVLIAAVVVIVVVWLIFELLRITGVFGR
jgi:hypothetical protein